MRDKLIAGRLNVLAKLVHPAAKLSKPCRSLWVSGKVAMVDKEISCLVMAFPRFRWIGDLTRSHNDVLFEHGSKVAKKDRRDAGKLGNTFVASVLVELLKMQIV